MVAITYDYEVTSSFPPARLFKALTLDPKFLSKAMPQGVKSVEILEGDGGVGTIKLITFGEGSRFKSAKHRVDGIDKDNFVYSYTTIEVDGGARKDVIESVSDVIKIEPSANGGSICKTTSTYHTKGDAKITEEEIKGKERVSFTFKNLEEYLLANPDACN